MAFDPDAYLKEKTSGATSGFDPDAYLQQKAPKEEQSKIASAIKGAAQGVSFGYGDEIQGAMEAGGRVLGIKGLGANNFDQSLQAPTFDLDELKKAYVEARDAGRANDKSAREANPGAYVAGEIVGGFAGAKKLPLGAAKTTGKILASGAGIGAVQGAGYSDANNAKDLLIDTSLGAGVGTLGAAAGKGIEAAVDYVAPLAKNVTQKVGSKLSEAAENLAYKASGAMLKDYRTSDVSRGGRWILDKAGLKAFDTVENVARKASVAKGSAGKELDRVYNSAVEAFGDQIEKKGFNPVTDRDAILTQVREELGDTVGADAAVKKVGSYLDEVAERHIAKSQAQREIARENPLLASPKKQVGPEDVRSMDPRSANNVKSAIDDQINYARNPLTKEPATEKAFSSARKFISNKVDEAVESAGGEKLLQDLKAANKDYGAAAQTNRVAKDRVEREAANKMFGLTDTILGGAGLAYGGTTGDWGTAASVVLGKKALQKYGTSALAVTADRISKQLLRSGEAVKMAESNPQAFRAAILSLTKRALDNPSAKVGAVAKSIRPTDAAPSEAPKPPRAPAGDTPRGEEKWARDGLKKLKDHGVSLDDETLLSNPKAKRLLIAASDLKPGSKAMDKVLTQLEALGGQN